MANIKHDHAVTQMALSNLDAWVNSPRVLSMIVCMVVRCGFLQIICREPQLFFAVCCCMC